MYHSWHMLWRRSGAKRCYTVMQVATSEEADEPGDAMDTSPFAAEEPPTPMRKRLMERLGSEALPAANGLSVAASGEGPAPRQPFRSDDSQPSTTLPAAAASQPGPQPAAAPKALLPAPVRPLLLAAQ